MFQYIICCWFKCGDIVLIGTKICFNTLYVVGSIKKSIRTTARHYGFNTLYVVGSILAAHREFYKLHLFQYIICCWFNLVALIKTNCTLCFNTLYVVGSMAIQDLKARLGLFQYIICCWFKLITAFI